MAKNKNDSSSSPLPVSIIPIIPSPPKDLLYKRHNSATFYSVRFGDHEIETTNLSTQLDARDFFRDVARLHRNLPHRSTRHLIVGITTFPYCSYFPKHKKDTSVGLIALCPDNSHCLIFDNSRYKDIPHALHTFLADENNVFVGVGIKKDAEKLSREKGVIISKPTELRELVEGTWGKEIFGKRKVVGVAEMAEVVMGMKVARRPDSVDEPESYRWDDMERFAYAARDAFLCREIADKCVAAGYQGPLLS